MKLYHSSNVVVEHPDTRHSRKYLDFGCGFYLTSLYDQAVRYAQRFKRRGQQAWLNTYEFSLCDETQWNIKRFDAYDEHWLDFVAQCRDGKDVGNYDMIIGGIANDSQTTYKSANAYAFCAFWLFPASLLGLLPCHPLRPLRFLPLSLA